MRTYKDHKNPRGIKSTKMYVLLAIYWDKDKRMRRELERLNMACSKNGERAHTLDAKERSIY